MITFTDYQAQNLELATTLDTAALALKKLLAGSRGASGLVSEEMRTSGQYALAKAAYDQAFQAMRTFNAGIPNSYKRNNRKYK